MKNITEHFCLEYFIPQEIVFFIHILSVLMKNKFFFPVEKLKMFFWVHE